MSDGETTLGLQLSFMDKWGAHIQLELVADAYGDNGSLAVTAYRWAADAEGPWCDITRNLPGSPALQAGQAYLADLEEPLASMMYLLGHEVEPDVPSAYRTFEFRPEILAVMRDWEQFHDAWSAEFEPELEEEALAKEVEVPPSQVDPERECRECPPDWEEWQPIDEEAKACYEDSLEP